MNETTLYIIEQAIFESGDVAGVLMTPDGETLHEHMSSSPGWLRADLTCNFGRDVSLAERFGAFTVEYVGGHDPLPEVLAPFFEAGDGDA